MKVLIMFVGVAIHFKLSAQIQKQLYIANDDHTDYMWSGNETQYREAFLNMLDYYITQADSTKTQRSAYQSRFNCDGTYWLWEYEKNKPAAKFLQLIDKIKSGHITVPYNALVSCYGANTTEGILRGMYYAGYLIRKYHIKLELAVAMENQTLPLGLGSLWAGSGAKYSWKGVCNCATKLKDLARRNKEMLWYQGLDGSRVLMKWYSIMSGDNKQLGGYAEARDPASAVDQLTSLCETPQYPYHIAGAFGNGWDNLQTITDVFTTTAREKTNRERQVIVSNQSDFFKAFEKEYGKVIPAETVSHGNEWDLYSASMAELSSKVKRSVEKLRAAEAMASILCMQNKNCNNGLDEMRSKAWMALGIFYEHNWTADGPVKRADRATWQRNIQHQLAVYVDSLYSLSSQQLGKLILGKKNATRFFAFNALSWKRSDVCDFPFNGSLPIKVVDLLSKKEVPSQHYVHNGQSFIRILASDIPSLGYKVYEIQPGEKGAVKNTMLWSQPVFENNLYKITLTNQGVITSLMDKTNANHEYVAQVNGRFMNDLGSGNENSGTIEIENEGPVSMTIKCIGKQPLSHTTRITLYNQIPRIEIDNQITENFGDVQSWAFSYNIPGAEIWHEELGAIIKAKSVAEGGNYADMNARYDWLTLNHFADINGINFGITLSNADCSFMKPGNSVLTYLDTKTSQVSVLAGGQVDGKDLGIPMQGGDSLFTQRFAIVTHLKYNASTAMQFSLEHQNPLVAGYVTGTAPIYPEKIYSFLTISDPNVLLWSLKPAEAGPKNGLIVRLWNFAEKDKDIKISFDKQVSSAFLATHVETDLTKANVVHGNLEARIGHHQIKTFRVIYNHHK